MNIAIVCDYFFDFIGGAQTSMEQQRRALEAAGHTVTIVSAARGRGAYLRHDGADLLIRPQLVLPGVELPVIGNSKRLRKELTKQFTELKVDIVHAQTDFGLAHAAADVANQLGIPLVHTVHTFYWAANGLVPALASPILRPLFSAYLNAKIPRRRLGKRAFDRVLRNVTLSMALRADAVVSPSAHQAADLESAGVEKPVVIIPNPIEPPSQPRAALSADQLSKPRFLWSARCEGVKRPLVFAEAAIQALARTNNGFSVDFVGEGEDLSALRKLTAGRAELRVHGVLSHPEVLRLIDESSITVLSSYGFDNQPMTIVEAVSRGRGVLYCDERLREGLRHAGYLTTSPTAKSFADAIVALVSEPSEFQRLSEGAEKDAQEFDPRTFVTRIEALYRSLSDNAEISDNA